MCNFAYFQKPISECSNSELIDFLVSFLNGADFNNPDDIRDYEKFKAEVPNRSIEFQSNVEYLESVL